MANISLTGSPAIESSSPAADDQLNLELIPK
jgi:hypothetical protein